MLRPSTRSLRRAGGLFVCGSAEKPLTSPPLTSPLDPSCPHHALANKHISVTPRPAVVCLSVCRVRVLEHWTASHGVSRFLCSPAAAGLSRAQGHCRRTSWPVCSLTPAVPGSHSTSDPPLDILDATGWEILWLLALFTSPSWQGGNLILTSSTGHGITNSACWLRDTTSA